MDIEDELRQVFHAERPGPDGRAALNRAWPLGDPDHGRPEHGRPEHVRPDHGRPDHGDPVGERRLKLAAGSDRAPVVRVLVVDDHALFRHGLTMVLDGEDDIEVVGQAADAREAATLAVAEQPDVVLMDVQIPLGGGIAATAAIKERVPSARTVMLTMSDEEADLYAAIKAGATGYLLKAIPLTEVGAAVRAVYHGQSLVSPSMATKLLVEFAALSKRAEARPRLLVPRLTDREIEVLRLVATGLNNRAIGRRLFITENTVKNHVRNILEKLQLHSRMEAVIYGVREKLIEIPGDAQ